MFSLKFGTDGIRTRVGLEPLTIESLPRLGYAIGRWATKYQTKKILLVADTRISCDWAKSALKSGLLLNDVIIIDGHVLPSPAVAALIKYNKEAYDIGIIISASHNPYHDNGIKIIDQNGKLTESAESEICALFNEQQNINYHSFGIEEIRLNASTDYQEIIRSFFKKDFLKNLKIVIDCAHGATHKIVDNIFKYFGAHIIAINNKPSGYNINEHCGSLHPQEIVTAVKQHTADIGFAFDGDGDRIIMINKNGQIKDGDDILALLSQHAHYQSQQIFVGTIMSNEGLATYFKNRGKHLVRTAVGDKYIAQELQRSNLLVGAEPSGHIILADYLTCSDGIFTALRLLETIQQTNNWNLDSFHKFPQIIFNVLVKEKKDLALSPLQEFIKESAAALIHGRLVVRYSGTEPLLRIMAEHEEYDKAQQIVGRLANFLTKELS